MSKKEFFDAQTDLTASKILIYRQYLSSFLPKALMQYGKCFIADFFCGCGKNGDKDGSPLALIEVAKKSLESPVIRKKWPNAEVVIVFSDADKQCCDNLTALLQKISLPSGIKVLGPYYEDFNSIKTKAAAAFEKIKAPKFFFLDPFTYSDIGIDDVKAFMDVPAAEVLLFLPTFHSYRFVKCANEVGALKNFLGSFTDRGCADYADINDFNESIRQRLLKYMGLQYVRVVGLDDGAKKNALFYLTKHITGMLLMNKLVWKVAHDGVTVKAKRDNEPTLFNLSTISGNFARNKKVFLNHIKEKKCISNVEVIDFVARNCFDTKYANDILKDMKKQGDIDIEYKHADKTRGFYVADNHWDEELAVINYKGQ
jgi:three-Cys-motif partner protein